MPDWCRSELTVAGEDLVAFAGLMRGRTSIVETFMPTPSDLKGISVRSDGRFREEKLADGGIVQRPVDEDALLTKYGARDWYEWNLANWGCNWPEWEFRTLDDGPSMIRYEFQTPWNPPQRAIATISARFPTLLFTIEYWTEAGDGCHGRIVTEAGVVREESYEEGVRDPRWGEETGRADQTPKSVEDEAAERLLRAIFGEK